MRSESLVEAHSGRPRSVVGMTGPGSIETFIACTADDRLGSIVLKKSGLKTVE